jgi:hypothetical protein
MVYFRAIHHARLGYPVVITSSSATILFQSISNNNAWRNTSFDAQNIVSDFVSSSKAYHGAPACCLPAS